MKINLRNVSLLLLLVLINACREEKPHFLELGKKSFESGNYPLARSQFQSIKSDNPNYNDAKRYLNQIDSIENAIAVKTSKRDSINRLKNDKLREKFAGNYKIEVSGVSSKKEVEIYQLENDGKAEWLWIYYKGNAKGYVDDRKIGTWSATDNSLTIDIQGNSGMISETYVLNNNKLVNKTLKKRRLEKTSESY